MKKTFKKAIALIVVLSMFTLLGCSSQKVVTDPVKKDAPKIRIAIQFGLGYAPVQIVQEKKLIEKYLPGAEVEWKQMGGEMIREAMIAGHVDVGFTGVAPFFIAWDKGADWKIATALLSAPLGLMTNKGEISSLKDFTAKDKIATPYSGSIQHMLLAMAAEKELGDPTAMDNNLVSMQHPDAATALLSERAISAHFAAPPYLYEQMEADNIKQVLNGEEVFGGEFGFLVGSATKTFHDNNPMSYAAFVMAMNEAITFINNEPKEAAKILAPSFKLPEETLEKYLTWPGTNYTSTPYGLMGFAQFMNQAGYISRVPASFDEICWENVSAAIGKKSGGQSPVERAQFRDADRGN